VPALLGSALGLSQPLSGFLARPSSTALFRAATVPDRLLQSVPPAAIVVPSRGHQLPCRYPPAFCNAPPRSVSRAVSPTPTPEGAVAKLPRELWVPFRSEPKPPRPGRPGSAAAGSSCPARFTDFEALLPLSGPCAPTRVSPRRRSVLSWSCSPSEFVPRASRPSTRPTRRLNTDRTSRARMPARPCRATTRTAALAARSEPHHPSETGSSARSAVPGSLRTRTAPPLGGVLFSLDLSPTTAAASLAFGASKCTRVGDLRRDRPPLMRFRASSTAS
jgi:hypothetical protein